jgi:hypothetical protein
MPKVNNGYQIDRDKSINVGPLKGYVVDSVGWGTNDDADGAGPSFPLNKLGGGGGSNVAGQSAVNSYWKSGGSVTVTTGGDGTAAPSWQLEATWGEDEISEDEAVTVTLFEVGTSAQALSGKNPAGNDGTALYTRKRVGGTSGLGKTQDFSIVARVLLEYQDI